VAYRLTYLRNTRRNKNRVALPPIPANRLATAIVVASIANLNRNAILALRVESSAAPWRMV